MVAANMVAAGSPVAAMMTKTKVINELDRNACTMLLGDIQALESRAHRLGMTITGHALNNAKNAAGWELAGETALAGKAARGERAGQ